jgi:hypothetical protein
MIKAGGKNFKTKTSLQAYCKYVLNNANVNTLLEGEWEQVLNDVLKMHLCFEGKTKGQAFRIGVRKCSINPRNRQFYILRSDGTDTDFSYYKAISESKDNLVRLKETLRASIKEQVVDFKESYFVKNQDRQGYVICPETNLKVRLKDSHIDHYPKQFDEIVKEWADLYSVVSAGVVLINPGDNSTAWTMEDTELLKSFQDYHKENAEYRIVLNKVNLQRKKAKRAVF